MKKVLLYIIGITTLLCLFASCSKDKDEPDAPPQRIIPYFKWPDEAPNNTNLTCQINAEAQTLTVVAHSNMDDVRVDQSIDAVWIELKEMIKKPEVEQIEFVFNIYPNISGEERTGYVSFGSPFGTEADRAVIARLLIVIQAADNP